MRKALPPCIVTLALAALAPCWFLSDPSALTRSP